MQRSIFFSHHHTSVIVEELQQLDTSASPAKDADSKESRRKNNSVWLAFLPHILLQYHLESFACLQGCLKKKTQLISNRNALVVHISVTFIIEISLSCQREISDRKGKGKGNKKKKIGSKALTETETSPMPGAAAPVLEPETLGKCAQCSTTDFPREGLSLARVLDMTTSSVLPPLHSMSFIRSPLTIPLRWGGGEGGGGGGGGSRSPLSLCAKWVNLGVTGKLPHVRPQDLHD